MLGLGGRAAVRVFAGWPLGLDRAAGRGRIHGSENN